VLFGFPSVARTTLPDDSRLVHASSHGTCGTCLELYLKICSLDVPQVPSQVRVIPLLIGVIYVCSGS
jgi:hypothetical protein